MRYYVFFCGVMILALGKSASKILTCYEVAPFQEGALILGGSIIICGLFSLKYKWHGLVGAGVLGLLGAACGLENIPGLIKIAHGERPRGAAPILEFGVTLICLLLLIRVLGALRRERARRVLELHQEQE